MTQARETSGQTKVAPITTAEAKKWLRILDGDTSEDDLIAALIASALDYVETFLNKCVALTLFTWDFQQFESTVTFRKYPFNSIFKVEYLNTEGVLTTLTAENYEVVQTTSEDAMIIFLNTPDTYARADGSKKANTVTIHFRCGYESGAVCPASIKIAIRLLVCKWYDNREDGKKEKLTAVDNILSPIRNINF